MRLEPPTKRDLILFAYAWAGAWLLGGALQYPAIDAMSFTRWLTGNPAALLAVSACLAAVPFFLVAALFEWLAEGPWAPRAVLAWALASIIDAALSRFAAPSLIQAALNLAFCLAGSWLAYGNLWRPALREAREALLSWTP